MERRRKKTKKSRENQQDVADAGKNQNHIPVDLVYDVLQRLPMKSAVRFLSVSKQWASIIRSREFIRTFHFRYSLRKKPRLLIALSLKHKSPEQWHFFSTRAAHLKEKKRQTFNSTLKACPDYSDLRLSRPRPHYVQGLMSFCYGQVQLISNPSTGKCLTLPKIESTQKQFQSFFGYDPISDQYKVLARSVASTEHQVYTLGLGSGVGQSWRKIGCNFPHYPETDGVCMDGVVYYGAYTYKCGTKESWIVRFEIKSEKLHLLVRLPHGGRPHNSLINYEGKVASANTTSDCQFDLWVLKDVEKSEWSKISISIYPWKHSFGYDSLEIRGILHTGEIIFAPSWPSSKGFPYVIYYDYKRNRLSKRIFRIDEDYESGIPFLDYVESLELL